MIKCVARIFICLFNKSLFYCLPYVLNQKDKKLFESSIFRMSCKLKIAQCNWCLIKLIGINLFWPLRYTLTMCCSSSNMLDIHSYIQYRVIDTARTWTLENFSFLSPFYFLYWLCWLDDTKRLDVAALGWYNTGMKLKEQAHAHNTKIT